MANFVPFAVPILNMSGRMPFEFVSLLARTWIYQAKKRFSGIPDISIALRSPVTEFWFDAVFSIPDKSFVKLFDWNLIYACSIFHVILNCCTFSWSVSLASLPPVELKKLRAQQRKAAKRAEQEKQEKLQQQQREQREREQREREQRDPHSHHQKRAHNQQDKEADAPPVDDLQPQKLARVRRCLLVIRPSPLTAKCVACDFPFVFLSTQVEDPLEQAIKFLQPLQEWGSNYIETHLLAFEVYFRKGIALISNFRSLLPGDSWLHLWSGKPLLMAQSVKRALKVDPGHPQLHSCLIRLHRFLTDGNLLNENVSHPAVASVLKSETQPLFRHHQEAEQLNKEFLEQNANSLPHLLQGA